MNTNIELWKKTKKGNRFWKVAACEKWNGAQVDEGSSKNKVRTLGGVLLLLRCWVWLTFNANGLWPLRNDRQQIREAVTRPGRIFSNIYRTILSLSPTRAEMKSQIPYLTAAEERKSKVIISFSCLPEENCPTNAGNGMLLLHKYCFALLTMMRWAAIQQRLEWAHSFSILHEVKSVLLVLAEGLKWSMHHFWPVQRTDIITEWRSHSYSVVYFDREQRDEADGYCLEKSSHPPIHTLPWNAPRGNHAECHCCL